MWFPNLLFSMQCFQVLFHYFFTTIFWIPTCFCLDIWIFLKPIFQNYIIHTYFNCFMIPTYHIFICKGLFHWQFHKTMSKDNAENNNSLTNYVKILIKFLIKRKKKKKMKKKTFTSKWV